MNFFNISHRNQQRAFTLIELMVVILILAVLGGMGLGSYRKALMRNAYFEDIEKLSGAVSSLSNIAKTSGLLMNNKNQILQRIDGNVKDNVNGETPVSVSGKTDTCLVWRLYKDNVVQAEGSLGSRYSNSINVTFSKGFKNGVSASPVSAYANQLKSGTCLSFYKKNKGDIHKVNVSEAPLYSIIFRQDGTPLYAGFIKFSTNENITKKQIQINIDKFGGVKVNDTVGM